MIAIDTSLLVYAHRGAVAEHEAASQAIARAARDPRGWGIALASVAEFYRIVTHPRSQGRASTGGEASRFLGALADQGGASLWQPGPGAASRLLQLAEGRGVTGSRIFDLQIALTVFDNGATEIWTHDRGFVAFSGIRVVDPLS